MKTIKFLMVFVLASLSNTTLAQNLLYSTQHEDFTLGLPSYKNNGCPQGRVGFTLSPDSQMLSVLFDDFVVTAGGSSGVTIDRKSYSFAIPIHVPQGYSVAIISMDYRG